MPDVLRVLRSRRGARRLVFILSSLTLLGVASWWCWGWLTHRATAQSPAERSGSARAGTESTTSDYTTRVVAYIHNGQAITRQDLGEFLIQRYGADRLPLLLNKRIVDEACRQQNINITSAEVEAALAENMKGLAVDRATFLKTVLARSGKNLYEWKEDILRPQLQMTRLVQSTISISEEDLRKAYESVYGEKVEGRLILWKLSEEAQALAEYGRLRESEAAFAEKARTQTASHELAATGGKLKPIGRNTMAPNLEQEVFRLHPGQVSTLIKTPDGIVLFKCDRRIPADTTVHFDTVREKLAEQLRETKTRAEIARVFAALKKQANPQPLLKKLERLPAEPTPPPTQVVGYLHGNQPVTREELGEFLIARYGAEKIEFLVNRKIIDRECQARGVTVSDEEVEEALKSDLKMLNCDQKAFEKEFLSKMHKNIFEWREDVIRPRLMLTRLCQGRVKCTEEDLQKGFEAYYGERLECRLILWPPEQAKYALSQYTRLRDSEEEFDRLCRSQPTPSLAAQAGKIPIFGRNSLGDENLEREAFKLKPGEITPLIGTAQGQVVLKVDRRIPPDTTVTLSSVRDKLTKEILDKKVQMEMQVVFKELRDKAKPQLILKPEQVVEDLLGDSKRLLSDMPLPGNSPPQQ
jgi:parvulin-like peptidyl-prolyl isomerase